MRVAGLGHTATLRRITTVRLTILVTLISTAPPSAFIMAAEVTTAGVDNLSTQSVTFSWARQAYLPGRLLSESKRLLALNFSRPCSSWRSGTPMPLRQNRSDRQKTREFELRIPL